MTSKAFIGRSNGRIEPYAFEDNQTIQDLINMAGLTLAQGEGVKDEETNNVSLTSTPEADATYYIVPNVKSAY